MIRSEFLEVERYIKYIVADLKILSREFRVPHDKNGSYGSKCGINGVKMKNTVTGRSRGALFPIPAVFPPSCPVSSPATIITEWGDPTLQTVDNRPEDNPEGFEVIKLNQRPFSFLQDRKGLFFEIMGIESILSSPLQAGMRLWSWYLRFPGKWPGPPPGRK